MKLTVTLPEKKYSVIIKDTFKELTKTFDVKKYSRNVLIITDSKVKNLYLKELLKELKKRGFKTSYFVVPEGEKNKNLIQIEKMYHFAVKSGIDRKSIVFALGGGVIGDMAGYFASTFLRGIPFMNLPTTLLADVDACLGGKTGVNLKEGKNLVGTFYQPDLIYININALRTLSKRIFLEGISEIIKYGIILDRNFFISLSKNKTKILKKEKNILKNIVFKSLSYKKYVVQKDEKEKNLRMILNFGHTFGHAIETLSLYKNLKHGEAVAIGMVIASRVSNRIGLLKDGELKEIEKLIKDFLLPVKFKIKKLDEFVKVIFRDKKKREDRVNLILPIKIGKVKIIPFEREFLKKILQEVL